MLLLEVLVDAECSEMKFVANEKSECEFLSTFSFTWPLGSELLDFMLAS